MVIEFDLFAQNYTFMLHSGSSLNKCSTHSNPISMKLLGNIIWLLFGGIIIFLEYLISSVLLIITIIGIPFAFQTLKLAQVALWPFNKQLHPLPDQSGCLTLIMNILWLIFGGFAIVLSHIGVGLILFVTIVGFPWGLQHFKLARVALTPFSYQVR